MVGILGMCQSIEAVNSNINIRNNGGATPLHVACRNGQLVLVRHFLKQGVNVDVQDNQGNTPLHIAAKGGFAEIAKALVQAGASTSSANSAGQKAKDCAIQQAVAVLES